MTTANYYNFTLTNDYNVSGQTYSNGTLRQMTSSFSDASHPGTLFSAANYNAFGELFSDSLGNGVDESFGF